MNQVVRVNATDKRIAYVGPWIRGKDNTMATVSVNSHFFYYVPRFDLCLIDPCLPYLFHDI